MIKLTAAEHRLFSLLLEAAAANNLPLTLRVAGGWVRDKLLGRLAPKDIDIALDNMMGEKFAELLHKHLQSSHIESHGFGVIKKNPDKSKHLETATIKILDYWVDFVNLRGEEYAEHSRIPAQTLGSPEQDAFRRDFTINALFFNINAQTVEDFTGRGLEDLASGVIRTPLDPFQTLMDDPLRILRGFRFAARFGFELDKEVLLAARDPKIKEAFRKKISRERVGKEFFANFANHAESKDCFLFYRLLWQTGYWPLILETSEAPAWLESGFGDMQRVDSLFEALAPDVLYLSENEALSDPAKKVSLDELRQFILLSVFTLRSFNPKLRDHSKQFIYLFIAQGLKLGNKYSELAVKMQRDYFRLKEIAAGQGQGGDQLEALGLWQRESHAHWRLVESLLNVVEHNFCFEGKRPLDLRDFFERQGLAEFYKAKFLFDGNEVKNYFGLDGRKIREKQEEVLRWQIRNPAGSKEDYFKSLGK